VLGPSKAGTTEVGFDLEVREVDQSGRKGPVITPIVAQASHPAVRLPK